MTMEISVIGNSKVNLARVSDVGLCKFSKNLNVEICSLKSNYARGCNLGRVNSSVWPSRSATDFRLRASASAQNHAVVEKAPKPTKTKTNENVTLYVGLPLDTVSRSNKINHTRAIAAGLKALKLLGVDGVELPVWWGIAESESMGKYDWSGYLAAVEMVRKLGLKVHVSLCFHASQEHKIPLPEWVSRVGESNPSIYFTDRSGQKYKNCLSLSVDDLPVLDGKNPLEVYKDFCENFKSSFSHFMGSTITGVSVGLGPDGELRYPSHHKPSKSNTHSGAGEFQCYDKNMLDNLKHHAETQGNPLWGLGGPHDAPNYNHSPLSGGFFSENGGSWESPYGDFFLSWYSSRLVQHGDKILSLASSTFRDVPITLCGKIPLMHQWSRTRSHASELAGGIYSTVNRNGYEEILETFSKNSCKIMLPGLDLSDDEPRELLNGIMASCKRRGVRVSGQNASVSCGFEQIRENLLEENTVVDVFTYQRMGEYFFSPQHFPSFTQFVRGLKQPLLSLDVLQVGDEEISLDVLPVEDGETAGKDLQMQAA